MTKSKIYRVDFITIEQGDDLIVSFAVAAQGYPLDILSLTLLRTPKYEFIFDPDERGISVSWEEDEDERELLLKAEYTGDSVKLKTTKREFILDVHNVRKEEIKQMRKVLHKMNFDRAIQLSGI